MSSILEQILAAKRLEVAERKSAASIKSLEASRNFERTCLSLSQGLRQQTGIIAEFKRKSPSKGIIRAEADPAGIAQAYERDPAGIAQAYERAGAAAISVLTDSAFFGGSTSDLESVRAAVTIPVLRKEFIIDEYQVIEAKALGADLILLIAAALSAREVKSLSELARSLGLEVLLEIHDYTELDHIAPDIDLIGVNNRSLKTFQTSLQCSLDLAGRLPSEKVKISESGLHQPADLPALLDASYRGFLIGERFMKSPDPGEACGAFVSAVHDYKYSPQNLSSPC